MTVSELIEKLRRQPQDHEVLVSDINGEHEIPLLAVEVYDNACLLLPDYTN